MYLRLTTTILFTWLYACGTMEPWERGQPSTVPNAMDPRCAETNRNPGNMEHALIQSYYKTQINSNSAVEFSIPGAGRHGGVGYADIVDLGTHAIYEIKTFLRAPSGVSQAAHYRDQAKKNCDPEAPWHLGTLFPDTVIDLKNGTELVAKQYLHGALHWPGVIVYYPRKKRRRKKLPRPEVPDAPQLPLPIVPEVPIVIPELPVDPLVARPTSNSLPVLPTEARIPTDTSSLEFTIFVVSGLQRTTPASARNLPVILDVVPSTGGGPYRVKVVLQVISNDQGFLTLRIVKTWWLAEQRIGARAGDITYYQFNPPVQKP